MSRNWCPCGHAASAYLRHHGHGEQEHEEADQQREEFPPRSQLLGPAVHHARHERLHVAELAVHPEDLRGRKRRRSAVRLGAESVGNRRDMRVRRLAATSRQASAQCVVDTRAHSVKCFCKECHRNAKDLNGLHCESRFLGITSYSEGSRCNFNVIATKGLSSVMLYLRFLRSLQNNSLREETTSKLPDCE